MAALLVITPAALSSKPLRTRPLARSQPPAPLGWFLFGTSATYVHFASLYPQLPGLFGDAGLQPVLAREAAGLDNYAFELRAAGVVAQK